jgi:Skp family chaperone for outer membrane proteins
MDGRFARAIWLAAAVLTGAPAWPVLAQGVPAVQATSPILTIDQDALYQRSLYGKALRARVAEDVAKLEADSRRIDAELEAEERALTQKRSEMIAADFAPLAAAFDKKAQDLRAQNAAAVQALRLKEQDGRKEFFTVAAKVLGDFMVERGASAIIDKGAVIVALRGLDVTDEVVARIDEVLGDGTK